jgi:hypothetical protein
MSRLDYVTVIICRLLSQATASWSGTFRFALVVGAAAAAPVATIVLITILR